MSHLATLVASAVGQKAAATILDVLDIDPALTREADGPVSRAVFAMAMNAVLFHDIMGRVPLGAAYVSERRAAGHKVLFDHGALRTIDFGEGRPTGALPGGHLAFARILEPLGYAMADLYPLDRLKMTGRAYAHVDFPEAIPQFFVSELHVTRFSPAFQVIAHAVFDATADALGIEAQRALAAFAAEEACDLDAARAALPQLVAAFERTHGSLRLEHYQALKAESAEAAWIATEGQSFNHATDRIPDVEAVADAQKVMGRPIKDAVEVSASGRVRQTAFKAQPVERAFVTDDGEVMLTVPGSFHEFISRDPFVDADGVERLDLRFDSSNAQGIFKMTGTG
uniref:2-oxoadipate dioxygenase/decarboxylase n=1 Tax=Caulobacter sp. (strain K31) TaxID=366602 RepID=B0SZC0_CAUSK